MTTDSAAPGPERATREVLLVSHSGRVEIAATAQRTAKIFGEAGIGLRVLDDEVASTGLGPLGPDPRAGSASSNPDRTPPGVARW